MFEFLYSKLRIQNSLDRVLKRYQLNNSDMELLDEITGEKYSIIDFIIDLNDRIKTLEDKYQGSLIDIKRLEQENVELTNSLYEMENRLESKIDSIHPVVYNLKDYSLGDS